MSSLYRKIFGDSSKSATETTKKLRITTRTTYRLMMKQAGGSMGGEEAQVYLRICPAKAKPLTTPQDDPSNHTFPKWTQRSGPKVSGGDSPVSDTPRPVCES